MRLCLTPPPAFPQRPDIDGLRALAVLAVLGYHAFPQWVPGGFVGVDVFFVISGYLISGLILRDLALGRFSLADFWQRRVRRIFPALLVMLAVLLAVDWCVLMPTDLQRLLRHTAAASGFVSNIVLWQESGYFEAESHRRLLLHTWSLAIEEQFYIVWPLLLAGLMRWAPARRHLLTVLMALTLGSFVLGGVALSLKPVATFFLLPTRLWELSAGACLAAWPFQRGDVARPRPQTARWVIVLGSALGGVLLAASLWGIDEKAAFPGWLAGAPVGAALLLIASGGPRLTTWHPLTWPPVVALGRISYSLYLWHWPMLGLLREFHEGMPPAWQRLGVLLVSVAIAAASQRWVERPWRRAAPAGSVRPAGGVPGGKRGTWLLVAMMAGLGLGSLGLAQALRATPLQAGLNTWRPVLHKPAVQVVLAGLQADADWRSQHPATDCASVPEVPPYLQDFCQLYPAKSPGQGLAPPGRLVLWGDSHALAWAPALVQLSREHGMELVVLAHTGCPPLTQVRRTDPHSDSNNCQRLEQGDEIARTIVALHPRHVFLVAYWQLYTEGLQHERVAQLATHLITRQPTGAATLLTSHAALSRQLPDTLNALAPLPVTLVNNVPQLQVDVSKGVAHGLPLGQPHDKATADGTWVNGVLARAARQDVEGRTKRVNVINPFKRFCPDTEAACRYQANDALLYVDDNHITAQGALLFLPAFADALSPNTAQETRTP